MAPKITRTEATSQATREAAEGAALPLRSAWSSSAIFTVPVPPE